MSQQITDKPAITLHVGLPKTGSTTMQQALFRNHSEVYYLGKIAHDLTRDKGCRSKLVYDILRPVLWENNPGEEQLVEAKRLYREQLMPLSRGHKARVGSWESFGIMPTVQFGRIVARLQEVFGSSQILFVIRNPLNWFLLQYYQAVLWGAIKSNRPWMGRDLFSEPEAWLEKLLRARGDHRDVMPYAQNIRLAIDCMGRENVGVFLFEKLQEDPHAYFTSICGFIGIDPAEGVDITAGAHLNKPVFQVHLDKLRRINDSRLRRTLFNMISPDARRRWLGVSRKLSDKDHLPLESPLSPELIEKIGALTRDGNQWIMANLGLPLGDHGYPL